MWHMGILLQYTQRAVFYLLKGDYTTPTMDNQMDKNMETDMETGVAWALYGSFPNRGTPEKLQIF